MNKIAHFIAHSKAATIVAALLCVFIWGYTFIQSDVGGWHMMLSLFHFIVYAFAGILLIRINSKFAGDSQKITLPSTLFFMCCAIIPHWAVWLPGTILLVLMVVAISILLHTYRDLQSMGSYFVAFALLSAGSLYVPQLLFLIPVLLLCCGFMQSLNLRAMFAALLGVLLPYWTAFCVLFLADDTQRIQPFIELLTGEYSHVFIPLTLPFGEGGNFVLPAIVIQVIWTSLLVLPAVVHLLLAVKSKMQARVALLFQTVFVLVLMIFSLIFPSLYKSLQPIIVSLSAIIGSTLFTDRMSRGKSIWLMMLLLLWLFIVLLYLWNSFSIS